MKIPIVKEYGSWAVFIFSCVAGLITGLLTRPWQTGKDFSMDTLLTILGLMLLINSKNPLSSALRTKSESTRTEGQRKEDLLWFMFFSLVGVVLLIPFLTNGIKTFLFFFPPCLKLYDFAIAGEGALSSY
jgi:hypothetical protein